MHTQTYLILHLPILDLNDTRLNSYSAPSLTLWQPDSDLLLTTLWTTPLTRRSARE